MRGLRILLFVVIPLSFAFGIGWGWKVRRDREASQDARSSSLKIVRVLALPHLVPKAPLQDFETSSLIRVEVTEAATPHDLAAKWMALKAQNKEPDLVTLLYSQIPETSKALKLQPLTQSKLPSYASISKDFIDWPQAREWPTTVPIAWGFDGWAILKSPPKAPTEKKVLWVATLAMTSGCVNTQEAHSVAEFLISRPAAVARVQESSFASTSLETETASGIDESMKPSALRRVPLTDYMVDAVEMKSEIKEPESE